MSWKLLSAGRIGLDDFELRVGHFDDASSWTIAPAPREIRVRPSAGENGSDRISLVWDDHAIVSQWLEVTLRATKNTGLMEPDVFYFASLPGDANGDGQVDGVDLTALRAELFTSVGIDSVGDFNRDGFVNDADFDVWNEHKFMELVGPPIDASPRGGIVVKGTEVTLTKDGPGTIYYTTDGSDPWQTQIIDYDLTLVPSGAPAQFLVPTSNALIQACANGVLLRNSQNCFLSREYTPGTHGESWIDGSLSVGFGADGLNTEIEAHTSVYVRIPFEVTAEQKADIKDLRLNVRYDDGFAAYFVYHASGLAIPVEVVRSNAPGNASTIPIRPLPFDAAATSEHNAADFVTFDLATWPLNVGLNYLVLQSLSQDAADMFLDVELVISQGRLAPADTVTAYTGPITIDQGMVISARTFDAETGKWSAMSNYRYVVADPGDANLDGDVGATDLNIVGRNWRTEVDGWSQGDFNGDRFVDAADLNLLGRHWRVDTPVAEAEARSPRAPLTAHRVRNDASFLHSALITREAISKNELGDLARNQSDGVSIEVPTAVGSRSAARSLARNVDAVFLQDALAQHGHNRPNELHVDVAAIAVDDVVSYDAFAKRRWRQPAASGSPTHDEHEWADVIGQKLVDEVLRHDW